MEICIEMTKISGGHFGKFHFALYGFIYAKTGTTIFLFYNNAYVVIEIIIIRCLDAEINLRKDKNVGSHFVFGINQRWPYILKFSLGIFYHCAKFQISIKSAQFPQIMCTPLPL